MDLKHHVMMLLCDARLHLAPIVDPRKILDIGTGTGIWVMEMAEQYPRSMIWGTDLSPIQPSWYATCFSLEWSECNSVADCLGFPITYDLRLMTLKLPIGVGRVITLTIYIQDLW